MKNFFGFNLTAGGLDGEKFLVRSPDRETAAKLENLTQEECNFNRIAGFPTWVNVSGLVCLFLGMIFSIGFLEALEDISFRTAWDRAGWCFVVGAVLLCIGLAILVLSGIKRKRAMATPAYRYLREKTERLARESDEALGVPASARTIDVIGSYYKGKEGKEYKENGAFVSHFNYAVKIYSENDRLNIVYDHCLFAIPHSSIVRIQCIEKRIAAADWNKETPVRKGRYNNFKVGKDNAGQYVTKPYYRVVVRDENHEEYAILVPCYDIDAVFSATGKTAE